MEYKGYTGSVEYSEEDNCWFGKVLNIGPNLISYEAETEALLFDSFKEAVDDYEDTLLELNK